MTSQNRCSEKYINIFIHTFNITEIIIFINHLVNYTTKKWRRKKYMVRHWYYLATLIISLSTLSAVTVCSERQRKSEREPRPSALCVCVCVSASACALYVCVCVFCSLFFKSTSTCVFSYRSAALCSSAVEKATYCRAPFLALVCPTSLGVVFNLSALVSTLSAHTGK